MKSFALAALLFAPALALANDGGIVGVDALDFKVEKTEFFPDQDRTTRTPIELKDRETIEASFTGNVGELFKLLPGSRSVMRNYDKHFRTLVVAAKEGYLTLHCENADMTVDQRGRPVYTAKPIACAVSINKYETPVTDEYKHDLFGDWEDLKVPRACRMK